MHLTGLVQKREKRKLEKSGSTDFPDALSLEDALKKKFPEKEGKWLKWTQKLAEQDLDTVGDLRKLSAEHVLSFGICSHPVYLQALLTSRHLFFLTGKTHSLSALLVAGLSSIHSHDKKSKKRKKKRDLAAVSLTKAMAAPLKSSINLSSSLMQKINASHEDKKKKNPVSSFPPNFLVLYFMLFVFFFWCVAQILLRCSTVCF